MKDINCEFENWKFEIDEVSANVYKVRGTDKFGRSVERIGTDPDELLEQCKEDVKKITLNS